MTGVVASRRPRCNHPHVPEPETDALGVRGGTHDRAHGEPTHDPRPAHSRQGISDSSPPSPPESGDG